MKILDKNDRVIFSSIEPVDIHLVSTVTKESVVFDSEGKKLRAGVLKTPHGTVYAFSKSKDDIKSSKTFISKLNIVASSLEFLNRIQREIEEKVNTDTTRLLHNLTSLNAHNMQEIYSLIPQESLANNVDKHVDIVEKIVKRNPRNSALAFLKITKYNAAIKTEFSVFKKLFDPHPELQERNHNVHKVLMNVLYLFFSDFTDKMVDVKVDQSILTAYFDYESIHVALYYIIENSVKYILPKSSLHIGIKGSNDFILVSFSMTSIQIKSEEVTKIFEEGFSGDIPKQTGKSGNGIGMSRVSRIVALNGGGIIVKTHPHTLKEYMGIPYQLNEFVIKIKKEKPKVLVV